MFIGCQFSCLPSQSPSRAEPRLLYRTLSEALPFGGSVLDLTYCHDITLARSNLVKKWVVCFIGLNSSPRGVRAGTQCRNPSQEPAGRHGSRSHGGTCLLAGSHSSLSLLFYTVQDPLTKGVTTHSRLSSPTSIIKQETLPHLSTEQSDRRIFSNDVLAPQITLACVQIDKS